MHSPTERKLHRSFPLNVQPSSNKLPIPFFHFIFNPLSLYFLPQHSISHVHFNFRIWLTKSLFRSANPLFHLLITNQTKRNLFSSRPHSPEVLHTSSSDRGTKRPGVSRRRDRMVLTGHKARRTIRTRSLSTRLLTTQFAHMAHTPA